MPDPSIPAETEALFQVITVHCFFHCGHIARDTTPEAASDGMERHYSERHADDLRRILRRRAHPQSAQAPTGRAKSRKRKVPRNA